MVMLLLTVEDTFDIPALGGLVVAPGPLIQSYQPPQTIGVTLKRPGCDDLLATLRVSEMFQTPPPKERRWLCVLRDLTAADVPIGTEVWVLDDIRL